MAARGRVSIPFIAGQWSLRGVDPAPVRHSAEFQSPSLRGSGLFEVGGVPGGTPLGFQSPSLRGSGLFETTVSPAAGRAKSFNPLHCGAVVSSHRVGGPGLPGSQVSIPFIAGQWSLRGAGSPPPDPDRVSIPFIAGQWSLPDRTFAAHRVGGVFQSPSLRGSGLFRGAREAQVRRRPVSIPFIAGQWSLHGSPFGLRSPNEMFQSPSLRGSGLF